MYKIGIEDEFEAIHFLKGDFGPETRLHGHRYRVRVTIEGGELDEFGMFFDISMLKDGLKEILSGLHYHNLNEVEGLKEVNPTVENVCRYIYEKLAHALVSKRGHIKGLEVTVWESPTAFASYRE
jgi:6-pyruvoyltetrahydropterin/6-carboxytetrahydropterin synthase